MYSKVFSRVTPRNGSVTDPIAISVPYSPGTKYGLYSNAYTSCKPVNGYGLTIQLNPMSSI
ncbi:hypothetical protein D1872_327510 [compost metagenome]